MAITGKTWSAVIYKNWLQPETNSFETVLDFDQYQTTPSEIAALYPSLSWDTTSGMSPNELRLKWLPQCYPLATSGGYASIEDAILDEENFYSGATGWSDPGNDGHSGPQYLQWVNDVWQTTQLGGGFHGAPAVLWANYPSANTYNITAEAPFGTSLGHGTIKHQALYYTYRYGGGALVGSQFPNPPNPLPPTGPGGVAATGPIPVGVIDVTHIFTPLDDGSGSGGSVLDGGGDGTSATDGLTLRCWGFSLDGHDYYVLRLGNSGTLVYDLTTGTWSEWESPGRTNWRAHVGQNWVGAVDFTGFDTDVVAGDDTANGTGQGTLFRLDLTTGRDSRVDISKQVDDKINHVVTGGIQVTGRDVIPCNAVTIDVALGNPTQTGAFIKLEISDDLGQTWTDCGSQEVVASAFDAVIEWRGLGIIKAPGRLFRFTDDGATVRFGGANLR